MATEVEIALMEYHEHTMKKANLAECLRSDWPLEEVGGHAPGGGRENLTKDQWIAFTVGRKATEWPNASLHSQWLLPLQASQRREKPLGSQRRRHVWGSRSWSSPLSSARRMELQPPPELAQSTRVTVKERMA